MKNLKIILSLILLHLGLSLSGQWVDSASATYNRDTLNIHIEGDVFIFDFDAIKRITDTVITDTVFVDVIFLPCSPFQQLAPYDTTFHLKGPFAAGLNHIRLYTIHYEDTIGSCYSSNGNQVIDTVNLSFNVPLSTTEINYTPPIEVFPNPVSEVVSYETNTPVHKIDIVNSTGVTL